MIWSIIGLLVLVTKINGNSNCSDYDFLRVQLVNWTHCDEENNRRIEQLRQQTLHKLERIKKECCVLTDTITCRVDALRSECGNEAANEMIANVTFLGDCASWTYPDSILKCQLWYTRWCFITIASILGIGVFVSLVVWGLRRRARR